MRPLLIAVVLSCVCTLSTSAAASPVQAGAATARLRPQGARAARLVRLAGERSPTVRRLVEQLEAGDVIVYLDLRTDLDPQVDGCLTWMAATASHRIVRASIKPKLRDREAIALVAHELQHAVEVLEHPDVRSSADLHALYARIGHATSTSGRHFDTPAAVATGALAWNELAHAARPGAARTTGAS